MSVPDNLILRYAELLTMLNLDNLNNYDARDAKLLLAEELVAMLYDRDKAQKQRDNFIKVFSNREIPSDIEEYQIKSEIWIVDLIVNSGCANSNSDARRLIKQGAITIDSKRVEDESFQLRERGEYILKAGKHRFRKIIFKN